MRWVELMTRMKERRGACWILVSKPEYKRPLGRPRRRWEDNIKMDLKDIGRSVVNRNNLAQGIHTL
jgi:hypothetical protein